MTSPTIGRLPAWRAMRPFFLAAGLALGTTLLDTGGEEAPPAPPPVASATATPQASPPVNPEAILQKNIIDISIERPPPPPPPPPPSPNLAPPPPPPPPAAPPPDVKPPFKLLGTVAGKPDASLAFLETGSKAEAVRVGEVWEQATVVDVARNRATIRWKNKVSTLEVDFKDWGGPAPAGAGGAAPPPPPPAAVYTPPNDVPMPDSIETRKVPRGEVDRNLQDLAGLLGSMRIQPYYESGQPSGFLLSSIRPGAFIDQVGIQNGDILKFVNGQKIDNVQNAFQLYNIFKNSTNVEATVMRDGRPVTLKYMIE